MTSREDRQDPGKSTLSAEVLQYKVAQLLLRAGMPQEHADVTSGVLVDTSLRGVETHGVEKLPMYLAAFERGTLQPSPTVTIERGDGPTATIDAGAGLGFLPSVRAAELAVELAERSGVGAVAVRASGHFGAGGQYVRSIAEAGMVGFISTNARPLLPRPGGNVPLVGNNPFAFGAPRAEGPAFVLDMACSVSAFGKVRQAQANGEHVPLDWGFDAAGEPTPDPAAILAGGFLAPIGGYKGFNLALMMELLSAALCGAALGPRVGSVGEPDADGCGHFVMALAPERFGQDDVAGATEEWLSWMRSVDPGLRVPGEAGHDLRAARLVDGVPVSAGLAELLDDVPVAPNPSSTPDQQVQIQ